MITIVLPTINCSAQVGDIVYFSDNGTPKLVGTVITIGNGYLNIDENNPGGGEAPPLGAYIMFGKDSSVNISGLTGYYADAKFENDSRGKIELFSIGSEISESSK